MPFYGRTIIDIVLVVLKIDSLVSLILQLPSIVLNINNRLKQHLVCI